MATCNVALIFIEIFSKILQNVFNNFEYWNLYRGLLKWCVPKAVPRSIQVHQTALYINSNEEEQFPLPWIHLT